MMDVARRFAKAMELAKAIAYFKDIVMASNTYIYTYYMKWGYAGEKIC